LQLAKIVRNQALVDANTFEQPVQLFNFSDTTFNTFVDPLRVHLLKNVFQGVAKDCVQLLGSLFNEGYRFGLFCGNLGISSKNGLQRAEHREVEGGKLVLVAIKLVFDLLDVFGDKVLDLQFGVTGEAILQILSNILDWGCFHDTLEHISEVFVLWVDIVLFFFTLFFHLFQEFLQVLVRVAFGLQIVYFTLHKFGELLNIFFICKLVEE
jgi:hypothetical protein